MVFAQVNIWVFIFLFVQLMDPVNDVGCIGKGGGCMALDMANGTEV